MSRKILKKGELEGKPIDIMSADTTDGMETKTHEATSSGNTHGGFAADALSNYLVLKTIFQHLENDDVNSCCQVNKCWNSVADPILVRYYDIQQNETFPRHRVDARRPSAFDITKQATYNSKVEKFHNVGLGVASSLLEAALQTGRIGIHLKIILNSEEEGLVLFLSKFGKFVEKLDPECRLPSTQFYELLVRYVQNVKHLDLSSCTILPCDEYFDGNLLENQMRQLRVVYFGDQNDCPAVLNILRMAPNLEEIHAFPIQWGDALVETQTASFVKSLCFRTWAEESVLTSLEKLSNVELKLKYFSFNPRFDQELFDDEDTWPFVLRILQSSHDSLESLTLWKTHSLDYRPFPFDSIPPMNSLKEITFLIDRSNTALKFFDHEIVLAELFPNVTVVKIPWDFFYRPVADMTAGFPVEQYAPWGSHIETLKLECISVNTVQQVHKLFPSVKRLEFWAEKCIRLQLMLKAFGKYWPDMESLTVVVYGSVEAHKRLRFFDKDCTFDSVFTGVPDSTIRQLRGKSSRRDLPSEDMIQGFKEASTIRKLSKLKMLKFDFHISSSESRGYDFLDKLLAITPFSKEFGFEYVPKLEIVVQTHSDHVFEKVSQKMGDLEACVNFKVEIVGNRWR